ncbi:MAG: DUF2934 domain-containing protein [Alphaproteobacteria bacterium]|nr:DUF2934 domain-containing protein [Alphaproteobacteria bacterium]
MDEKRTQKIRDRAHAIWEEAGRPEGRDAEHWAQAEREIAAADDAAVDAPKAKRGRTAKAVSDMFAEGSEDAPKTGRGRKRKALTEDGVEAPKATRGRTPKAASGEAAGGATGASGQEPQAAAAGGDAPKARRGRKPKVVAEGSDTAE